nr:hypothetical protein 3 - rat [Rattus norvegicus]
MSSQENYCTLPNTQIWDKQVNVINSLTSRNHNKQGSPAAERLPAPDSHMRKALINVIFSSNQLSPYTRFTELYHGQDISSFFLYQGRRPASSPHL